MQSQPKPAWESEDVTAVRDAARKFYAREMMPHIDRWEAAGIMDRTAWNKAGEAGLLCAGIPAELGGGGATFAHEAAIYEEQYRAHLVPFGNIVHSGICAHYVNEYGSEEQKQRWLPRMATGELVCAIAMTEPGAGSDLKAIRTTATRSGNEYVISGSKTFITNGQHADLVILVCKTDPKAGARGVSLVVVETKGADGFRRGRNLEKIGQHAADTSELFFEGVRVPLTSLLGGEEGQGFAQLMQSLPRERLALAVGAVAAMEKAVEITTEYARERKAFGERLIDLQSVRFTLAECLTEARVARAFLDDCIERFVAGTLDTETASMAKLWTTERQCKVIDKCLQLHGGYGYMREFPIARMYVDARVERIYGGANEVMKEMIGRAMAGRPVGQKK